MCPNRYELHFHTSEVSRCAHVSASESVLRYHELGYQGIVVTDHYHRAFFEESDVLPWSQQVDRFWSGYETAARASSNLDLIVLPGMEIRFDENNNDYLVYGMDRAFLEAYPRLYEMTLRSFRPLAEEHGLLVFQAHPFRNTMTIMHPYLLDGIEVFNGNVRHDARNDIAALWARKHALRTISGSDFHRYEDAGLAGLDFAGIIRSCRDLVDALSKENYNIYKRE
jgi:hypothetical protein